MADDIVDQLRELLNAETSDRYNTHNTGTHYKGCWHKHTLCALNRAVDEIEWLQSIVEDFAKWVKYQQTMEHNHHSWEKPLSFFELQKVLSRYKKG